MRVSKTFVMRQGTALRQTPMAGGKQGLPFEAFEMQDAMALFS